MKKELSLKETEFLRLKYWALQEKQNEFQTALNEIAEKHGINLIVERWNATSDFKSLIKAAR